MESQGEETTNDSSSLPDEVTNLERKLELLKLDSETGAEAPVGVNLAMVQSDIRTVLKNIEALIQRDQQVDHLELSKVHSILTTPLKSPPNGNDVSSVMSYLKLLAEICPPIQGADSSLEDVFWTRVLEPIADDILSYLNIQVFQKCFATLSSSTDKTSSNDTSETPSTLGTGYAFHQQLGILLKGVRILLIYLKRAIVNLPKGNSTLKSPVTECLTVLSALMDPLKAAHNKIDFDIGLDIRCNIGVGVCYSMTYLCYPNVTHVQSFFRTIFATAKPPSISWSNNENMILDLVSSDTNRIALAFGVLNTWLEQEHDEDLYFSIASNILNIEHGVKEAVNLGSARVLEIWTTKLARPCIPINVLKHVSTLFPSLEFFCYMYMSAHIDAVKNCCRNILSALSQIYHRLDEEKVPFIGEGSKCHSWVTAILNTILDKLPHIKWIALACVVRNTKKSLVSLDLDPLLPEKLLTTQRTYKSAANDTYVALMSYYFERESSEAKWEKIWIDPLFSTQFCQNNESNWPQKKNIISMILNSEKFQISHMKGMIIPLLKSVVKRMNRNQSSSPVRKQSSTVDNLEDNLNAAEAALLAAETIKMAYELKITIDAAELKLSIGSTDSNSAPEDSFRGLVPRSVLNNWLWHENPQIRLAGFALLVETKKTSDIISKQDFESLKIFFKYNLLSQSPAFRQQYLSYFKKLVRRLRDGEGVARRKKDNETVKSYESFLQWLWQFLTEDEGLFFGANFARRCQSLECLSELTEHFPNGFEIFGLTSSGNTKYLRWLTDSYENNKMAALEIMLKMPMEEFDDEAFCSNLFNQAVVLCKSIKPPESVTGRYLMILLMRKASKNQKCAPLNILEYLYSELETMLKKIETTSLIQVSSESPMYGCIRCIRMILGNTTEYRQEEHSIKYRNYVAKLLKLCFIVDDLLFPVLGSAAPEGFLPGLKDSAPDENKQVVRSLAAQMLLVCAWRSMKEICLLMSDMCCWFVMEGESSIPSVKKNIVINPSTYLLTFDQVSSIGDHLLYLLKNLMHRGVFEQVFVGFKQLSTRLWKSSASKLNHLPEKWLQHAIDQEHISAKSITRRSAGLPFIFQALLSAESENEQFIQMWVERLMIFDETPEMAPIRIHSMNVLRGLFRDATFSSAIMPFVPHGLKMSFRGLKSLDWTERNSGLMLYGAVMRRTFGAKLNLMNAPTFFRKFPQMYDFLLNELDICVQLMEKRKRQQEILRSKEKADESLPINAMLTCDFTFHLLLLLSSFTSSGRVEDTHFKLAEFIPRIRKCGDSDDMEVRKLSAKALIPFLVSPEDKFELAQVILNEMKKQTHLSQNKFHGLLTQFLAVVCLLPNEEEDKISNETIANIVDGFISMISLKLPTLAKASPTVYAVVLEIFAKLNEIKSISDKTSFSNALQLVSESFDKRFGYCSKRNVVPGLHVADKIIASRSIKILASEANTSIVLEQIYNYFSDTSLKSKPYIDQFLELMQEDEATSSALSQHLFTDNESTPETVVIVEAVIGNYLRRVISEFSKFPGTEVELYYLNFIATLPPTIFKSVETDEFVSPLIRRMFQVCDNEDGKTSSTLPIKAAALLVLGKIAFSTEILLSLENKTELCDMILQWSGSDVDDDLRFAVAKSFPSIPFANMQNFSATNQAKLWSSILLLAQDDESSLRQIVSQKITNGYDNTCCDRKSLEVLVHLYIREFLIHNPIDGLLVLMGLLLREDFQVEAKAADDETEDRIFDKSEMNMYLEPIILAKTIKTEMASSKVFDKQFLALSLDKDLQESQVSFFHILTNITSDCNRVSNSLTIRKLLTDAIKSIECLFKSRSTDNKNELDGLTSDDSIVVKKFIHDFIQDVLRMTN